MGTGRADKEAREEVGNGRKPVRPVAQEGVGQAGAARVEMARRAAAAVLDPGAADPTVEMREATRPAKTRLSPTKDCPSDPLD